MLNSSKEYALEAIREIAASIGHIEQSCLCAGKTSESELDDAAFCLANAQTHVTNILLATRAAQGGVTKNAD